MISGRYVKTFAEATHAVTADMSMNADYPFMQPLITANDGKNITISEGGKTLTSRIRKGRMFEFIEIEQTSSYEAIFRGGKPSKFRCHPFQDERAWREKSASKQS